jgi:hypothetical protein
MSLGMGAVRHDGHLLIVHCLPDPLWASPDDEDMIIQLILEVEPRWMLLEGSPVHTARQRRKGVDVHIFQVAPVPMDEPPIGLPVPALRYLTRALADGLLMAPVTLAPTLRVDLVVNGQRMRILEKKS